MGTPELTRPRSWFGTDLRQAERAFRVMGTDAHIVIWQPSDPPIDATTLLDDAHAELARLEELWSRFLPESDVCRVNDRPGDAVVVSPDTLDVLDHALLGVAWSEGRFDPTLLRELEQAGYDRTFDALGSRDVIVPAPVTTPTHAHRCSLRVDRPSGTARVATGDGLDLGGIGKGRAADIVAARLLRDGAVGACVNVGGDLRVIGEVSPSAGIVVGVEDALLGEGLRTLVQVRNAAVATSSRTRRTWHTADGRAHHLIDPASGRPADAGLAAVTVIAPTATWAEIGAKSAFLAGAVDGAELLERSGYPALLVADDGAEIRVAGFERFEHIESFEHIEHVDDDEWSRR